ncbi:MAG: hypothetical protein HC786_09785 [Richelia sp. CSU_2_1]|nr:hypothetical protein [Microcoleus sp. SU_5_6]NJL68285.1 hypothetical protein [Microcoleus sp. SM1_3_4]NJR22423.1 hypothetical protein [Richelia sp. CSU_2_1]
MSNINSNSLANLKHFEGKWKHGVTKSIRVPVALADEILAIAHKLDKGVSPVSSDTPDVADLLNQLKSQNKKSKATLSDVEALLSLIFT